MSFNVKFGELVDKRLKKLLASDKRPRILDHLSAKLLMQLKSGYFPRGLINFESLFICICPKITDSSEVDNRQSKDFIYFSSSTVISRVVEISNLSSSSNDLAIDLASTVASVVSSPAIESRVHLRIQSAHVALVEDLDIIGSVRSSEGVFFVAIFAGGRSSCFLKVFKLES